MASTYETDALAKARKDGLKAEDVAALDYRGTAALCAAKVEANGNSPADFFYVRVRHYVADTLQAEVDAAELTELRLAVQAAVNSKFAVGKSPVLTDDDIKQLVKGSK